MLFSWEFTTQSVNISHHGQCNLACKELPWREQGYFFVTKFTCFFTDRISAVGVSMEEKVR